MKVIKHRHANQKAAKFTVEFTIFTDDVIYTMLASTGMYGDDTYDSVLERLRKHFPTKDSLVEAIKSHAKAGGDNYNELMDGGMESMISSWGDEEEGLEEGQKERTLAAWDHGKRLFPSLFK